MAGYDEDQLKAAGFSDAEISQNKAEQVTKLQAAGFSPQEINEHMGAPPTQPKTDPALASYVQKNLESFRQAQSGEVDSPGKGLATSGPKQAVDFGDAFTAGLEGTSGGLLARGRLPDVVLPEHAEMAMRIAHGIGSIAGDLPAMVAGGLMGSAIGGAEGSVIPGAGTVAGAAVGADVGAQALPMALREYYTQQIRDGSVKSFGDFWSRTAAIAWEAMKGGTIGAATGGAGSIASEAVGRLASDPVASALSKAAANPLAAGAGSMAAQIATMTAVGKGLEGKVPEPSDFLEGAILVAGFHAATKIATTDVKSVQAKLQDIYAKTGMTPGEVGIQATNDPVLKQELLAPGNDFPKSLEPRKEQLPPGQAPIVPPATPKVEAQVPKPMAEHVDGVNPEFATTDVPRVEAPKEEPKPEPAKEAAGGEPPKEPPAPGAPMSEEEAHAAIAARIGDPTDPDKPKNTWANTYRAVIDKFDPIKRLEEALVGGGKKLIESASPYWNQLSLNGRAVGISRDSMENGPRDFFTQKRTGTPGLKEIFAPFKDDLDAFLRYGVAKHAIELSENVDKNGKADPIETGVPLDAAKVVAEAGASKYEEGMRKLVQFQNDIMKYMRDAGVIRPEVYDKSTEKWDYYLPFFRLMEDGEESLKGRYGAGNVIKKISGSDKLIAPPAESLIRNTYSYIRLAESYRGRTQLVDLAGKDNPLAYKVTQPATKINVSDEEMAAWMKKNEIFGDPADMSLFRRFAEPLRPGEIDVMRDGKREVWQVGEDAAKAYASNNYQPGPLLKTVLSPLSWTAKLQRMGITEDPSFLLKHGIRSEFLAFIQSKNGYIPVVSVIRGIGAYFKDPSIWHDFVASGGAQSTLSSMDRSYIQEDIAKLTGKTGVMSQMQNVIENPMQAIPVTMKLAAQAMRGLSDAVMNAPKFGEFANARAKGKDLFTAGSQAADVTTNYYKVPDEALFQAWNQYTPFFQMHLRGLDKLGRSFADPETRVQTATRLSAIAGLSLALWFRYRDDDRYKNAPDYEKDLSWIIPTDHWEQATSPGVAQMYPEAMRRQDAHGNWEINNGTTYRLPKPFEPGILVGSGLERMAEALFQKNPRAFDGFGQALLGNVLPNIVPAGLMPIAEQWANKQWLSGRPIVSDRLQGQLPAYRYTPYTSETAKAIGKYVAYIPYANNIESKAPTASPAVIDNYVRQWGGSIGQYLFQASDKFRQVAGFDPKKVNEAESTLADIPFIRSYVVRYPSANTQVIDDFYHNLSEVQAIQKTSRALQKRGDVEDSDDVNSEYGSEGQTPLSGVAKAIAVQRATLLNINQDPHIEPRQKRQLIDGLYYQMTNEAAMGNKMFYAYKQQAGGTR